MTTAVIETTATPAAVNGAEVFIPLNKLKKSDRNARKTPHSEASIEAKAASIHAKGILQNLVVAPELDADGAETGFYFVTIGEGRRLAQLLRVKRKQIKKTEPIRCVIDTQNDPTEISLDENVTREENQIEKAYGPNNSILDNCHVRVSFATNDERTAKRVSDALGTATEMRAMRNYAGHRLSPWLGHLMVSRSETARPLLTPGEVMQLPPADEIVMVAGTAPIRAKKARYFEDRRFQERIIAPPQLTKPARGMADDWSTLPLPARPVAAVTAAPAAGDGDDGEDPTGSERRHQPELARANIVEKKAPIENEFDAGFDDDAEEDAARVSRANQVMQGVARQVSLDPNDGMEL